MFADKISLKFPELFLFHMKIENQVYEKVVGGSVCYFASFSDRKIIHFTNIVCNQSL